MTDLLKACERLVQAASARENTMGDPIRLLEVQAELRSATQHARETIVGAKATLDDMRATDDGRREQIACAKDALKVLRRRLQAVDSNWARYRPLIHPDDDYRKLHAAVKLADQLD